MERRGSVWRRMAWIALAAAGAALLAPAARLGPGLYWWWRSDNPVRRGALLAAEQGCFSCHAPTGRDETANPGSRWGTVPSFFRGNTMMYVKSREQVSNFIAFGNPQGEPEPDNDAETSTGGDGQHPPFRMPAFGDRLSRREINDLTAFVLAADGYLVPPEGPVARGAELSAKLGCEGCHGVAGAGGVINPRSFTGIVPGWVGPAFCHLVRDEGEFRQWVREGRSERWRRSRLGAFFLDRANLHMPAFGGVTSREDVEDLWAYVQWLRSADGPAGE